MIIRRSRRFSIQMQQYENYSFGAEVEMGNKDLGISDEAVLVMTPVELSALRARITEAVLEELDEQLIGEIEEVADLTDNRRSFLLKAIASASTATKPKPKPQPRKVTRRA